MPQDLADRIRVKPSSDPLPFLLALNLDLAKKEADGDTIVAPGLPRIVKDASSLVTNDAIQP